MIRVYHAIDAKKTRAEFGKTVEKKRDEIKRIPANKTIQTQIFKEFLAKELQKEDIIKAKENLLKLQNEKKSDPKESEEKEILKNIVAYSESEQEINEAKKKLLETQKQEDVE
jgi:hypothetical protein